ncbi:uncharacterized protein K452DRAFT_86131 [Aplosporella prunicola CBS 121167]|uniref:Uncharacterized protein n=1 Tax=Aplosporella prunicola CBS 121167 TaxID=1176127 RepID=A0A6A6B6L9_9PEZI|nr:uncharacterized protein K452DRAFT_86131 [Aplosporella prunicola CBS 121167]KAF2138895.1 hypothetical protein K452DRAFT_86131 [Aplosporella prunicola CBS 121167]
MMPSRLAQVVHAQCFFRSSCTLSAGVPSLAHARQDNNLFACRPSWTGRTNDATRSLLLVTTVPARDCLVLPGGVQCSECPHTGYGQCLPAKPPVFPHVAAFIATIYQKLRQQPTHISRAAHPRDAAFNANANVNANTSYCSHLHTCLLPPPLPLLMPSPDEIQKSNAKRQRETFAYYIHTSPATPPGLGNLT